jgi:hypothetical protein
MKETLTCTQCNSNWKREVSRGRKPVLCPKCLKQSLKSHSTPVKKASKQVARPALKTAPSRKVSKPPVSPSRTPSQNPLPKPVEDPSTDFDIRQVYSILSPKPKNYQELLSSTKNGSTWQCPLCKHIISVAISILQPPSHRCTPTTVTEKEFVRID